MNKNNPPPIPVPETHLVWNLYGSGFNHLGRQGRPERVETSQPGPDQILVRIDCVGICYSDVKLLNQGNAHPKISGRNLANDPTRPGHEVSFTVVSAGSNIKTQFLPDERYSIQPEVMLNGRKNTYGFSIPGGLTQYQLIGPELLDTDQGSSILKIDPRMSYAETALLEPWGSVLAAYSENRRLVPKKGGKMWILNSTPSDIPYSFSRYLDLPDFILVSDLPGALEAAIIESAQEVSSADGYTRDQYLDLTREKTRGKGFDDIVLLNPGSASQIQQLISLINPGGLLNLVGTRPLNDLVTINPQRIHYEFVALVGNSGREITASYGADHNRSDFRPNGTAFLYGGGGPMGQMHLQRALIKNDGPKTILVCEVNPQRIIYLKERFEGLAGDLGKELFILNLEDEIGSETQHRIRNIIGEKTIDDLIVLVPRQEVLDQTAALVKDNGLINLFAGTPAGLQFKLDPSKIYLGNLQITGASGLTFTDYREAYKLAQEGEIDLNTSVAAVGGMMAASQAIRAAEERLYSGKIVIYPQLEDLPLLDIRGLAEKYPELTAALRNQFFWTRDAEALLFELTGN